MTIESDALGVVNDWFQCLETFQNGLPAKGAVSAALHVLDRLKVDYRLDTSAHVSDGEGQIAGLSAANVKKLLERFGETRKFSSIGGRSNRGARGNVSELLLRMKPLSLEALSDDERAVLLESMQRHIVETFVPLYFEAKRVKASFDPSAPTSRFVGSLLADARQSGKGGAVAEHLVGAKLSLLYPGQVRKKPANESDEQQGFHGDFELGTTVFHITVSPMSELFEKCRSNIEDGFRVYLLVPESQLAGSKQLADTQCLGRVSVNSIETFVATNIDEMTDFDGGKLVSGIRKLLDEYNARVAEVEIDKSLLIEIPPNL